MYGCIDETSMSLTSPRMIDGDECVTLAAAFAQAEEMMAEDVDQIAICRCKYFGEDGNGYWGEMIGEGTITIDAQDFRWADADADEETV